MIIKDSEFQDQLVRGLAHKMNNILSLFHGYLALLMDDNKLSAEAKDGLSRIKESAYAASELIDRTKSLARPSSVVWRELKMPDFFFVVRPSLMACLERGITFELDCADDIPPLWAEAGRVRTILVELVKNAVEATPDGGVVRIEIGSESPHGRKGTGTKAIRWAAIRVVNVGGTLSPEMAERIFEPFYTTHQQRNAAGLGLTVASNLTHQLGGVIWVESEAKRTCFKLMLPSRSV
jgi:signal transduction histidine kinase